MIIVPTADKTSDAMCFFKVRKKKGTHTHWLDSDIKAGVHMDLNEILRGLQQG